MKVKKSFTATLSSFLLVATLGVSVTALTTFVAPEVYAAPAQKISEKVGKPVVAAKEFMAQKKYKEALDKINEAAAIGSKSAYEDYVVNSFKLAILMSMGDTVGSTKQMETMLAANQITADQMPETLKNLQSNYFRQKDYAKSIQFGDRYLKEVGANADIQEFVARAYYLKGDFKSAIEIAKKLVHQSEQAKRTPDKAYFEIIRSGYFKLDDKDNANDALESLLIYYPTQQYWKEMFSAVENENTYSDKEKIEILRLKKVSGAIESKEYIEFGELCLAMTDPGDAKAILEAGTAAGAIKADERNTKLLNRAKADAAADLATLDATDKEAEKKPTGEASAKMGFAYLGHGKFDKAAVSLQRGITKGGLGDNLDLAYVQLGVANFSLGKKAEATKAFQSVSSKGKLARVAKLWVIYSQKH